MSQNWEVEPFLWKYACYAGGYHPLRSNSLISRTFIFINLNINHQITQVFASSSLYSPHQQQSIHLIIIKAQQKYKYILFDNHLNSGVFSDYLGKRIIHPSH